MKPILFSTEMVKAILAGRKSQTRRVVKGTGTYYPTYNVGDVLWVRETWMQNCIDHIEYNECLTKYFYMADHHPEEVLGQMKAFGYRWKPSIHMPKEAARIFLKVINVRVERLQDISQADIENEGIWFYSQEYRNQICIWRDSVSGLEATRKKYYKELWDSIYQKRGYGWETNPFVWIYEFERVEVEG